MTRQCNICFAELLCSSNYCLPCQTALKIKCLGTEEQIISSFTKQSSSKISRVIYDSSLVIIHFESGEIVDLYKSTVDDWLRLGWMVGFFSNNINDDDEFITSIQLYPTRDLISGVFEK